MLQVALIAQILGIAAVRPLPPGPVHRHFPEALLRQDPAGQDGPGQFFQIPQGGKQPRVAAEVLRPSLQDRRLGIVGNAPRDFPPADPVFLFDPVFRAVEQAVAPPVLRHPGPGFRHARGIQDQLFEAGVKGHARRLLDHILQHHGRDVGIIPRPHPVRHPDLPQAAEGLLPGLLGVDPLRRPQLHLEGRQLLHGHPVQIPEFRAVPGDPLQRIQGPRLRQALQGQPREDLGHRGQVIDRFFPDLPAVPGPRRPRSLSAGRGQPVHDPGFPGKKTDGVPKCFVHLFRRPFSLLQIYIPRPAPYGCSSRIFRYPAVFPAGA